MRTMDGEAQPKVGLMISLVLMNLSAIALFFYTSNASQETSAAQAKDTVKTELMAGDARNTVLGDEAAQRLSNAETESPVAGEGAVRISKTSGSLRRASKAETKAQPKETAIAIAVKNFIGKSSSGVKIFFDGLRSYKERRISESLASLLSIKMSSSEDESGILVQSKSKWPAEGSPTSYETAESMRLDYSPEITTQDLLAGSSNKAKSFENDSKRASVRSKSPMSTQGLSENPSKRASSGKNDREFAVNGSKSFPLADKVKKSSEVFSQRQDKSRKTSSNKSDRDVAVGSIKSTPIIADGAGKTPVDKLRLHEEPTPSWIYGRCLNDSSSETLPAETVLDILSRTQKRTSELINIFHRKVVPAIEKMNEKVADAIRLEKNLDLYTLTLINTINSVICPKTENEDTKPKPSQVKSLKQTKAFCSDFQIQSSPLRDYAGFFRNGETCSFMKRPVFKTSSPRYHCRSKNNSRKMTRKSNCKDQQSVNCENPLQDSVSTGQTQSDSNADKFERSFTNAEEPVMGVQSSSVNVHLGGCRIELPEKPRTISIDEVLTLTSYLEPDGHSNMSFQPVCEGMNCDVSMNSRLESENPIDAPEESLGCALKSSDLSEDLIGQLKQHIGTLSSDISTICESHYQVDDSCMDQKQSSTLAAQESAQVEPIPTESISGLSNRHILDEMNNTVDLVSGFLQLKSKHKEVAMENICWLILRMFEAWSESQKLPTPVTISSTDFPAQNQRPRTAIFCSQNQSMPRANSSYSIKDDLSEKLSRNYEPFHDEISLDPAQVEEISSDLVTNIVEAAEVLIAEHTLMGLQTIPKKPTIKNLSLHESITLEMTASQSGFGDTKDTPAKEEDAVASGSHDMKDSKESSAASFYTGQPESSEDAFYECFSSYSATYGSLEVEDSSKVFLAKIQEEEEEAREQGGGVKTRAVLVELPSIQYATTVESWIKSGSYFQNSEELLKSEDHPVSESSSVSICGTDEEANLYSSQEVSADEYPMESGQQKKKKKWATRFIRKLMKKKSKPSTLPENVPSMVFSKSETKENDDASKIELGDPKE